MLDPRPPRLPVAAAVRLASAAIRRTARGVSARRGPADARGARLRRPCPRLPRRGFPCRGAPRPAPQAVHPDRRAHVGSAILADGIERRSAVVRRDRRGPGRRRGARGLARCDRSTIAGRACGDRDRPRSALVEDAVAEPPQDTEDSADATPSVATAGAYGMVSVPGSGGVVLGFEFSNASRATGLAERFPPQLARHAAAALSIVTGQLAAERSRDVAPRPGHRAVPLRLHGRPRAQDAADRPPRVPRADHRGQGRRSRRRARVPRTGAASSSGR